MSRKAGKLESDLGRAMSDLPDRLRAIADSFDGDEWEHPLSSAADCRRAAGEIERLRETLQNIMAHQETVGGTAAHLSGAFAIAKQALAEEDER